MNLQALQVSRTFDGAPAPALVDVSCAVTQGSLVAVVGPNGSGKTTLLRALLGLEPVDSGEVRLNDKPIAKWSRRELADIVAALPQREEPAFPLTVRETMLMGRWAALGPLAPATHIDEQAITTALERCDATRFAQRHIDTLSGGEWQRVRIARALVSSPKLLLLDEPTASLDMGHEMALFELLRALVSDGLGVLVITHHLNVAARFADRMILLDGGRAIAEGAPAEVMNEASISRVFEWPVKIEMLHDGQPQVVPMRQHHRPNTEGTRP